MKIIVNSGVTVGSTSTSIPALKIPALPFLSSVWLTNNGNIYGCGGAGGVGGTNSFGAAGGDGGIAISYSNVTRIWNYGNIKGGGGGGGGGAGYMGTKSCNCIQSKQKSATCCDCSYGCTSPKPGYQYHECLQDQNCYSCGCSWGDCWRSTCYSYNLITTCSTCNDPKSGGNGGNGQGSSGVAQSGQAGTSGISGGAGGSLGQNGSSGISYNTTNYGGIGGLAGYYIMTPNGSFRVMEVIGIVGGREG